jgi:hypothetical protein
MRQALERPIILPKTCAPPDASKHADTASVSSAAPTGTPCSEQQARHSASAAISNSPVMAASPAKRVCSSARELRSASLWLHRPNSKTLRSPGATTHSIGRRRLPMAGACSKHVAAALGTINKENTALRPAQTSATFQAADLQPEASHPSCAVRPQPHTHAAQNTMLLK